MATVTPLPFAVGLLGSLAAFGSWLYFLVQESRRPVRRPTPVAIDARPRVSHTRVAFIGVFFLLWSIWSTARPVSGWR